ncbi:hypothetical protein [Novosphingobium sp. AAP93]|uniref:hypothetical protein n=1 Tax=Novosphingobium sp. AAP93 TaxID=1523427 RepID=UPI0006B8F3F5|nr:hypothetical protein [Novosphingobium sp. AAP93]KPF83313.1 hypothetical protein IP83_10560 [Novosphingobium sp. AAP93]
MRTRFEYGYGTWDEPEFYLPRLIGGKLAVLVVILLLYLCISHQMVRHLNPSTYNLGMAHAEAVVMLTVFGGADTITTFTSGHKVWNLTRHTIVHADLFVQCWRALLWRIECGTIWAVLLVWAPPLVGLGLHAAWDASHPPLPEPRRARPMIDEAAVPYASHPYLSSEPYRQDVEEPEPAMLLPPAEEPDLPTLEVRKRPRKAKKPSQSENENPPPPAPPLVQPGQVRKRRKPEA